MQTATKGSTTWTYTYNADGLRTGKTNGSAVYTYTWNENRQLQSMTWDYGYAAFSYDANGTPYSVKNYDAILDVERTYLYVTNLQGDVLSVIDSTTGQTAVTYTYDAWGRLVGKDGTSSDYASIYEYNPLTYRGYIYDSETGFYYLQSRYYDPTVGRFLNADEPILLCHLYVDTFSESLYTYCGNNPIENEDFSGYVATPANVIGAAIGSIIGIIGGNVLGNWLADVLHINGWFSRPFFICSVSLLVGAAAAAIGYFIGPYIASLGAVIFDKMRIFVDKLLISGKLLLAKLPIWVQKALGLTQHYMNKIMSKVSDYVVKSCHLKGSAGTKSKFNTTDLDTIRGWIRTALRYGTDITINPGSNDSYVLVYDFGKVIGTKGETCIRIVFSIWGQIITVFPQK